MKILGLNNGGFYRLDDRLSDKVLNTIINSGVNAIEFVCFEISDIDKLLKIELVENNFKYLSIHAPQIEYKNDLLTKEILNKLLRLNERLGLANIVIHADQIKDIKVFDLFASLPISVENCDDRKEFGESVEDIKTLLDNSKLKLTLDLQHCYVNDQTMALAEDFYNQLADKICEFHLSGYNEKFNHYTLFKTKQDEILSFAKGKNVPIIIESTYDSFDEAITELDYIKNKL